MDAVHRREPEVDQREPPAGDHHVPRREVAHHDAAIVQLDDGGGELADGVEERRRLRLADRQPATVPEHIVDQVGVAGVGGHQEFVGAVREVVDDRGDAGEVGARFEYPALVAQPHPRVGALLGLADERTRLLDDHLPTGRLVDSSGPIASVYGSANGSIAQSGCRYSSVAGPSKTSPSGPAMPMPR